MSSMPLARRRTLAPLPERQESGRDHTSGASSGTSGTSSGSSGTSSGTSGTSSGGPSGKAPSVGEASSTRSPPPSARTPVTRMATVMALPSKEEKEKEKEKTKDEKPLFEEESMQVGNNPSEGMHTFGIGKAGISRAVVIFTSPPSTEPFSVCFHFPNTFLSHAYVLHCIAEVFRDVPTAGLKSLMFVDRNVMHGCTGLENRWIVRCRNLATKEALIYRGLALCNKRVLVRSYDDVIEEEYLEFTKYTSHKTKLYGNISEGLRRAGGGKAAQTLEDKLIHAELIADGTKPTKQAHEKNKSLFH